VMHEKLQSLYVFQSVQILFNIWLFQNKILLREIWQDFENLIFRNFHLKKYEFLKKINAQYNLASIGSLASTNFTCHYNLQVVAEKGIIEHLNPSNGGGGGFLYLGNLYSVSQSSTAAAAAKCSEQVERLGM
ncbi:hypothetical protein ACJX0J_006468, partial [Zea mays]